MKNFMCVTTPNGKEIAVNVYPDALMMAGKKKNGETLLLKYGGSENWVEVGIGEIIFPQIDGFIVVDNQDFNYLVNTKVIWSVEKTDKHYEIRFLSECGLASLLVPTNDENTVSIDFSNTPKAI